MAVLRRMRRRSTGRGRTSSRVLAAVAGSLLTLSATGYDVPGMRDAMRDVFADMRVLLELSSSPESLRDPANRDVILTAATDLADQAAMISEHAPRDELSFLAGSLERYASWILRSYEWGHHTSMQGQIHDAVDLCVACHTRLPAAGDSPLAKDFLTGHDLDALPAADRARLQVATRRFDDALATLERTLPQHRDADDFPELLRSYLVVALRVKNDPARARKTLEALPAPAAGAAERYRVTPLIEALRQLEAAPPPPADLAAARALIRDAEGREERDAHAGIAHYVTASRLLYQFLEAGKGDVQQGAWAYYLLGLTRQRLEPDAWLPQAELFLEKAVRTAPGSEPSGLALAMLDTQLRRRLATDGGTLPRDVASYLEMLKELHGD